MEVTLSLMTDYERTTTQETEEPVAARPVAPVADPAVAGRRVTTEHEYVSGGPTGLEVARRTVALLFGILQALLVLRIIFLLLIANRDNGIVQFVLNVTDPFVAPFVGMFRLDAVRNNSGVVLDIAAIVAIIGWSLVEALILAILGIMGRRDRTIVA